MFDYFKEDIKRYFQPREISNGITQLSMIKKIIMQEALWIIMSYRVGRWIQNNLDIPIVKGLMKIPYFFYSKTISILFSGEISLSADIGKGLYIGHFGGIWVGPIKMGEYCNISHGVTIGIGGSGKHRGIPKFGNRVYIGPGATIYGKITIGDNVAIGANSVVSKNAPDNAVLLGNPARVITYEGSEGLITIEDWDWE